MKKIKLALVGCGRISQKHFDAIARHKDNINLVAVCDNDKKVLSEKSKELAVPGFESLEALLENQKLDLVVLTTPSGLHSEQAKICARYGVHVMTEKPMATRWKDGLSMVKACDDNGVKLFIVKQNRYNPTLQLLKKAISDGRFGKIHMVNINVFWTRPQEYYDQAKWRGTWEFDGGAFMNQASHYVDLLDWLVGPVEKIQAMVSTTRKIEVEDTGIMNVKWRQGTLGSVNVTMLTYPKNLEGGITILGESGSVILGGVALNEIKHWDFEDAEEYDNTIFESNYDTDSVYGFGHYLYYENMIKSFTDDNHPVIDGREGLKSLEILIAAYLSARDGKTISLPIEY